MYVCLLCIAASLGGCGQTVSQATGERSLQPPQAGIQVGSLYYVRETPTASIDAPAQLSPLCLIDLPTFGVKVSEPQAVSDIDLQNDLDVSGTLSGIQNILASAGLDGKFSDYFTYKLTNAKRVTLPYQDAENIFQSAAFRKKCTTWRGNVAGQNWGIYQVVSLTSGDIDFKQNPNNGSLDANLSVKIGSVTPAIKASIKRDAHLNISGKGVVVSFGPLPRNVNSN